MGKQDAGYLKLFRVIEDHTFYKEKRVLSKLEAWLDILLKVRWKDEPDEIVIKGKLLYCHRGESLRSLDTWGRRWGWSKSKVRRYLNMLRQMNQIRIANETVTIRLSVVNFKEYQDWRNGNETATDTQAKRKRNALDTQKKKDKNVKKENKETPEVLPVPVNCSELVKFLIDNYPDIKNPVELERAALEAYPGVDLLNETKKAVAWEVSNPTKKKKNHSRFLNMWWSKQQDKGGLFNSNSGDGVNQEYHERGE